MAIHETTTGDDGVAISGTASDGERTIGVKGAGDSVGVQGKGKAWHGVAGISESTIGGFGVYGENTAGGSGVVGVSSGWIAVAGLASSASQGAAVYGEHKGNQAGVWGHNLNETDQAGPGVFGKSRGTGVWGESTTWMGVYGRSESVTGGAGVMGEAVGSGVVGKSRTWMGVHGETQSTTGGAGVSGRCVNPDGSVNREGLAGFFDGKVVVTNDLLLSNADCAEDFDVAQTETSEPGTVMVVGEDGALFPSQRAYDKRVAGVVSGAGDYKPGIVLDKQHAGPNRKPIALLGKVYCKVDAGYAPVEIGDLLTTSPTPGHAMKAADPLQAFGAVIGKALRPLKAGQGLVPILIALQ